MAKKEQVSEEKQAKQQQYNEYVKQVTPTRSLPLQMLKAFITGGLICTLGQFILNICEKNGLDKDTSGGWCSMILILLSIVLTGLNIYLSIAKWGGAGAWVLGWKTDRNILGRKKMYSDCGRATDLRGHCSAFSFKIVFTVGKLL